MVIVEGGTPPWGGAVGDYIGVWGEILVTAGGPCLR